jgi:molybdate transport system regulatory protein
MTTIEAISDYFHNLNFSTLSSVKIVFYQSNFEHPVRQEHGVFSSTIRLDFRYSFHYITLMHKTNPSASKKTGDAPAFHGRVWIDGPEGTFIGYGRVVLLERIMEHGSITKAAKSMEMAYRHAWDLVDSMNSQAGEPFVELSTGGKGGGGARVTEAGKKAIMLFRRFSEDLQTFLKREEKKLLPILNAKGRRK